MRVQFNRPVVIAGKEYAKGVSEVPNADCKDDWYFKVLEKDGALAVVKAAPSSSKDEEAELEAEIAAEEAEKKAAESTDKKKT